MLSQIARIVFASSAPTLLRQQSRCRVDGGPLLRCLVNSVHTSEYRRRDNAKSSTALVLHTFANANSKEKDTYLDILRQYKSNNDMRHGHVEFIRVALKYMDEFGVNRDLAVYKALMDVLPKGRFIPKYYFQTMLPHYPKQQQAAIDILCKMEHNGVIPDVEMQTILLNIFGIHSNALKKYWRMMYWMPKFANLNPWPCRRPAPKDPRVLARLAMNKVSSVDVQTRITEIATKDMEDVTEDTWIVSAMSSDQQRLLRTHSPDRPLYVEGPYTVWVADQCIDYFVLRGDAKETKDDYEDIDDVSNIIIPFWDKKELVVSPTVHEQTDGTYFAMCATGTSTKDSLLMWIRYLQKENPVLNKIPVVFKLASSTKEQFFIDEKEDENGLVQRVDATDQNN